MKFIGEELLETTFWRVVLAENQTYLGYCIVSLKRRDCGDLADLTNEEMLDFLQLTKTLENALRKAFNATMFNWSCLMNLAYQNTPPNPHVHWHFRPRYNHTVVLAGHTFADSFFGKHYESPTPELVLESTIRETIVFEIKNAIT